MRTCFTLALHDALVYCPSHTHTRTHTHYTTSTCMYHTTIPASQSPPACTCPRLPPHTQVKMQQLDNEYASKLRSERLAPAKVSRGGGARQGHHPRQAGGGGRAGAPDRGWGQSRGTSQGTITLSITLSPSASHCHLPHHRGWRSGCLCTGERLRSRAVQKWPGRCCGFSGF